MNGLVANTDYEWYQFLASQRDIDEVNFWRPMGSTRTNEAVGAPVFFKLKKQYRHAIVGFGFFVAFRTLEARTAWDVFGVSNGAATYPQMWERITSYVRKMTGMVPRPNHTIGCVLLASPVFFPPSLWVTGPVDWKDAIVAGKKYDISRGEGRRIWEDCIDRAHSMRIGQGALLTLSAVHDNNRFGKESLVRPRLGQGTFRIAVEEAYNKCAVTSEHSLPALEASHIIPYAVGGQHEVSNGLLLRADIHRLYDRGYVTVTPDYRFKVSPRLNEDFHNGKFYYGLDGTKIFLPSARDDQPSRESLEYHEKEIFLV